MDKFEKLKENRKFMKGFAAETGIEEVEIKKGYARGEIKITKDHMNVIGSVHGGCIFTLADTISGAAACSYGFYQTTVSGSINYLSPAINISKLIAVAKEVKHGKTISVYDVDILNEDDKLLANASFTYFNLKRPIEGM